MATNYYLRHKGTILGPFPGHHLSLMAAARKIAADDEISEDKQNWLQAVKFFPDLSPELEMTAPPVAQPPQSGRSAAPLPSAPLPDYLQEMLAHPPSIALDIYHLLCSFVCMKRHHEYLYTRLKNTAWITMFYSVLATLLPMGLFAVCHTTGTGRLWSISIALLFTIAVCCLSFLLIAATSQKNNGGFGTHGNVISCCLLTAASTASGTSFALLHGLYHPSSALRLFVLSLLLLIHGIYAVSSFQIAVPFIQNTMRRKRLHAVISWSLWFMAVLLILSALIIFHLRVL